MSCSHTHNKIIRQEVKNTPLTGITQREYECQKCGDVFARCEMDWARLELHVRGLKKKEAALIAILETKKPSSLARYYRNKYGVLQK